MAIANIALHFVVELIGFAAVGYWGSQVADGPARIVLAIAAPLVMIVVWAVVLAPKARSPLTQPQRDVIGTGLLLGSAAALAAAAQPVAGLVFGGMVIVSWILLVVGGSDARNTIEAAATGRRQEAGPR